MYNPNHKRKIIRRQRRSVEKLYFFIIYDQICLIEKNT